jgi:hypothetical protein
MKTTLTLLTALLLIGCGSVTKDKTSLEIESTKDTDTRTNTLITENTDSYTISPADLNQPIQFNGKTYTNTIIKYEKANKVTNEGKVEKVVEKVEIEAKEKHVERDYTTFIIWGAIMFIVMFLILLLFIGYYIKKINPLK